MYSCADVSVVQSGPGTGMTTGSGARRRSRLTSSGEVLVERLVDDDDACVHGIHRMIDLPGGVGAVSSLEHRYAR